MNHSKIQQFYDIYITAKIITLNDLYLNGFNSKDIEYLLNHNIMHLKDDFEVIVYSNNIREYVKHLLMNKEDINKVNACYKAILRYDTLNRFALFRLFIESVKVEKYEDVYYYLNKLFSISEEPFLNDCNFYLYLLAFIYPIPKKYDVLRNYAFDMNVNDVVYIDNGIYSKEFVDELNNIRKNVFNWRFAYAYNLYNNLTCNKSVYRRDFVSKILLLRVINNDKLETEQILNALNNNQLYEAYILLKKARKNHRLRYSLEEIYNTIIYIFSIILNKEINVSENIEYNGDNILKNIKCGNYIKAYKLLQSEENKNTIINKLCASLLRTLICVIDEINKNGQLDYNDPYFKDIITDAYKYKKEKEINNNELSLKLSKNL